MIEALPHSQSNLLDNLEKSLLLCDSYSRLDFLIDIWDSYSEDVFLKMFFNWWTSCDTTPLNIEHITNILGELEQLGSLQLKYAMPENLAEYLALPDELTVFRGCYAFNDDGICFSTDKQTAINFVNHARYKADGNQPILLTGKVKKADCLFFNDRKESEILSLSVEIVKRENILVCEK